MTNEDMLAKAIKMVDEDIKRTRQAQINLKLQQLEDERKHKLNKKLQDSSCPHTSKDSWNHGREEECRMCGAQWSY